MAASAKPRSVSDHRAPATARPTAVHPTLVEESPMDPPVVPPARFVGIDLHKTYLVLAAVDAQQQVVLAPRRLSFAEFDASPERHLRARPAVVFEAASNAWDLPGPIRAHRRPEAARAADVRPPP